MGYLDNMEWREARAKEILGHYLVNTAGSLMGSSDHRLIDGWIYANKQDLLFLSNSSLGSQGFQLGVSGLRMSEVADASTSDSSLDAATFKLWELVDDRALLIPIAGRSHKVTAPFYALNGIIDFGMGLEFVGAKKQIKAIAALCR